MLFLFKVTSDQRLHTPTSTNSFDGDARALSNQSGRDVHKRISVDREGASAGGSVDIELDVY